MVVKAITVTTPNITSNTQFYTNASITIGNTAGGATFCAAFGAPVNNHINGSSAGPLGAPANGSCYSRTDGGIGTRFYIYYSPSWVALSTL